MPKKTTKRTPKPVEVEKVAEVEESEAKKAYRLILKAYKAQSPENYALKEAELLIKLENK